MPGNRLIWLRLKGFEADPQAVRSYAPSLSAVVHAKGEERRHGGVFDANAVAWSLAFASQAPLSQAFQGLVGAFGGVNELQEMLADVSPCERLVEYWIPVRGSPLPENNFVDATTLAELARLNFDQFPEFDGEV
ncbi:MAG: hypothetical protein IT548_07335 [Alphaproteobacteria bacterium]|nr:hypothetical protein [Alphaproteobacteria bacterium]